MDFTFLFFIPDPPSEEADHSKTRFITDTNYHVQKEGNLI